jgi:4-diphosphocytidyl-2-C-methyl-D-erythritol kinase
MAAIDLHDTIRITPVDSPHNAAVSISWATDAPKPSPIDWPLDKDLAVRALRALEVHIRRSLPCRLDLRKRIPVGGGLGGGSSDAASTLLALRDAFALPTSDANLADLAASLGSDAPFFLDPARESPRPALVTGFGETITRSTASSPFSTDLWLLIPHFPCPTPVVYAAFDRLRAPSETSALNSQLSTPPLPPSDWFNDLQPAAELVEPRLRAIRLAADAASGLRFMLTGSGSTLIAQRHPDQTLAADRLRHALQHDAAHAGTLAGCQLVPARILA